MKLTKEQKKDIIEIIRNDEICNVVRYVNTLTDSHTLANLTTTVDEAKKFYWKKLTKTQKRKHHEVMATAHMVFMDYKGAAEEVIIAKQQSPQNQLYTNMLEQLLHLGVLYGKYDVVETIQNYALINNEDSLKLSPETYHEFLITKAIPNIPLERKENTNIFALNEERLRKIQVEAETEDSELAVIARGMHAAGSLDSPRKYILALYGKDTIFSGEMKQEFNQKKDVRRTIDSVVQDLCTKSEWKEEQKIQAGDTDDYFPLSAHLWRFSSPYENPLIANAVSKETQEPNKLVQTTVGNNQKKGKEKYQNNKKPTEVTSTEQTKKPNINQTPRVTELTEQRHDFVLKENIKYRIDFSTVSGYNMESELYERLSHPGLAKYHGKVIHKGIEFLVLDYVKGKPLNDCGTLKPSEAATIGMQLAQTLQYLHYEGVIYGDVKDKNIMYDGKKITLLDFGMASTRLDETKRATQIISNAEFACPETILTSSMYAKSDVFQLGIVLYKMLTGDHPFAPGKEKATQEYQHKESELIAFSLANIWNQPATNTVFEKEPELYALTMQMLHKDYESRPSMNQVAAVLEEYVKYHNPSAVYFTEEDKPIQKIVKKAEPKKVIKDEPEETETQRLLEEQIISQLKNSYRSAPIPIRNQIPKPAEIATDGRYNWKGISKTIYEQKVTVPLLLPTPTVQTLEVHLL